MGPATVFVVLFFSCISESLQCGQVKVGRPLSVGSEYASRGQFPWLVPLFTVNEDKFFCGSTIISERHLMSGNVQKKYNCESELIGMGNLSGLKLIRIFLFWNGDDESVGD
jgi:hypothetical protein